MADDSALVVHGVVVDAARHPVADARVALVTGPVPFPDVAVVTDDRGRFSLGVPRSGRWQVVAHAGQGRSVATIEARPGRSTTITLVLPEA